MNLKEAIFGGGVQSVGGGNNAYRDSIQEWLPVKNIIGGVVITKDARFIKLLEVLPVGQHLSEIAIGPSEHHQRVCGLAENRAQQPANRGPHSAR